MSAQGNRTRAAQRAAARPQLDCLHCGRPLAVHRKRSTFASEQAAEALLRTLKPWQAGVLRADMRVMTAAASAARNAAARADFAAGLVPLREDELAPATWTVIYTDSFGYYGDNLFCGATCGWNYAVRHAKDVQLQRANVVWGKR